ncbi:MAG: hypothetical protein IPN20_19295 [Haliscomenobacter sp.]|nr:hypothetical protein [Haliscomenobacter sp.]MBK8656004.1 hypothetical protein [Haliscomenobacter sp.]
MVRILLMAIFFMGTYSGGKAQTTQDTLLVLTSYLTEKPHAELVKIEWTGKGGRLKQLFYEQCLLDSGEITPKGFLRVLDLVARKEYDSQYDSLLVNYFLNSRDGPLFILDNIPSIARKFLRSNYNKESLNKLSFFSTPQSLLFWDPFVAEYQTFLELDSVGTTLLLLKRNLACLTTLNPRLLPLAEQDTLLLNLHLARLGLFNDTTVVEQIIQSTPNYGYMIELLCKVRTPYAFARIGQFLLGEAIPERFSAESYRAQISKIALSAYIRYVANFPDRAIKFQDTMDRWNLVTFSAAHGRDYSTPEYLDWARQWYREHQGALILDQNKF